jgi:hypothetical protein
MRKFLIPLLAAAALAAPSTALAGGGGDGDYDFGGPVVTPLPTQVTTEAEANTFVRALIIRNADRVSHIAGLRGDRGRQRVTLSDITTACLQHPVVLTRFGCIFRFNAEVRTNDRRGHGDRHYTRAHASGGGDDDWGRRDRNRDRVRSLGCLGALRINGGVGVTPTVNVSFVDCVVRPTATPYSGH